MPDEAAVDAAVEEILASTNEEQARTLEAALLEETDSSLDEEDPQEQPDQEPAVSFGPPAGSEMERVIARAESQVDVCENPPNSNRTPYGDWYGMNDLWCAMFVSWCFFMEGRPLGASTPKGFASTKVGATWFQKQGAWSTTPARGHVVFYNFARAGVKGISHIGIVTRVHSDGSIEAIEGNTAQGNDSSGGRVMRRRRKANIVGYGVPRYKPLGVEAPGTQAGQGEARLEVESRPLTTEPIHYPEDAMKSHPLAIDIDANGNGYNDLPGVPAAKVTSVVVNGADPQTAGRYTRGFSGPEVLDAGGVARVVLKANEPGKGRIDLTVWAVD